MSCGFQNTYPRYPLSVPAARPFASFMAKSEESPLSPWDLYQSYGLSPDPNAGKGVTVAVVAAFGSDSLQNDFNAFNRAFGLPEATVGILYSDAQSASVKAPENWRIEINADVSWLHAVASGVRILCVFAPDAEITSLMNAALLAAEKADIVSMSFGSAEFREETDYSRRLAGTGKLFIASSGDRGGAVLYPSASDAVISVGGAVFHRNTANGRVFAYSAWENGGGGPSLYTGIPNWQKKFAPIAPMASGMRATPDLALDACQNPGYAVYDGESGAFRGICGTSISAPVFAGMCARYFAENGVRMSSAAMSARLYELAGATAYDADQTAFHDVILGSNGRYEALVGFDLCTGLGVPRPA